MVSAVMDCREEVRLGDPGGLRDDMVVDDGGGMRVLVDEGRGGEMEGLDLLSGVGVRDTGERYVESLALRAAWRTGLAR
jgi:hypothetical protein